jgi:hypothetical protein
MPDVGAAVVADYGDMLMTGTGHVDAEQAFTRIARQRRRAAVARRLRRQPAECGRLAVYDERVLRRRTAGPTYGIREIPLEEIDGTLEPSKAAMFDRAFRPVREARDRWERVWLAEQRGAVLPPISVVRVGDGYAVRDGHHRVSVAKARGAVAIDAEVQAA